MSEPTSAAVECPICGEEFDPSAAGGWCTNPDCGEWQYLGEEVPEPVESDEPAADDEPSEAAADDDGDDEEAAEPVDADGEADEEIDDAEDLDVIDPTADEPDEASSVESEPEPDDAAESTAEPADAEADGPDAPTEADEPAAEAAETAEPAAEDESEAAATCPDCGEAVDEDDNFCANCGADLTGDEPTLEECPDCGTDVGDDDSFCANCGEDLEAARESLTDAGESTPVGDDAVGDAGADEGDAPESLVLSARGEEIAVADDETVGREVRRILTESGADEDEAVRIHREHVRFVREGGQFYLVDLGDNPTALNDRRLSKGDREPVEPGDEIELSGVVTLSVDAP